MIAHDLYAEINPAFVAYLLVSFVRGFTEVNESGPELPLAYLALPLVLSGDLNSSFESTNRRTGLQEWLERNPQIEVDLAERLNSSMGFIADAVQLGCFSRILRLGQDARISLGEHALRKNLAAGLSEELARSVRHADRLGFWCAAAGSTKTVFDIMGLTL